MMMMMMTMMEMFLGNRFGMIVNHRLSPELLQLLPVLILYALSHIASHTSAGSAVATVV